MVTLAHCPYSCDCLDSRGGPRWSIMDELLVEGAFLVLVQCFGSNAPIQQAALSRADPGPCLGFLHSYMSICYYYGTEPRKEIIDQVKVLAAHNTKSLNLLEFGHASEEDTMALAHGGSTPDIPAALTL
jgi:hypothetical protein